MTNQILPGLLSDNCIKGGPTYSSITSRDAIYDGLDSCLAGKLYRRKYYDFLLHYPAQLKELENALSARTYFPKPCREFTIFCKSGQKTRLISEPDCIDNVLHHTLYLHLYNVFDSTFIHDSYGCRKRKGTLRASLRCQQFMRQAPPNSYYLQLDLRKFYYSLDHTVLRQAFCHTIKDQEVVDLLMKLVNTTSQNGKGLNVGAMLSQLFGLIYLNRLDHYIKRVLKVKRYIRYVDDMVLIGLTREECHWLRDHLQTWIRDHLKLEFSKAIIQPISHGVNFVGYHTWPHRRKVRSHCLKMFGRALKKRNIKSLQSSLAHARGTCSQRLMLQRIAATLTYSQLGQFGGHFKHDLLKLKAGYSRQTGRHQGLPVQPARTCTKEQGQEQGKRP